ncbi:hypothetical protein LS73_003220 [Helicobacter muridarum]|uniref:Uncharacterized protein conserved in bacteria n=1 Tax=Helicobacter muridarum TaxID=216 RepID=A0A099U1P0_9HELI|nr:hypothetical protein [Helicobacter muridarum]TLE00924.1 hypothetical protein LS73_003220 [Helicobacter muridarum]STQ86701.1 Uncharacterized protein conserved in bacteria [Helicobacter muridarum]
MKNFIFFTIFAFVLCLCACSITEERIKAEYDKSDYKKTYRSIQKTISSNNNNVLLWQMQSGFLTFSQFGPVFSLIDLEKAESIYKKYEQEGILSSTFSSMAATLSNDNAIPYKGNVYEGSLLNFYKALAYSSIGDFVNARVEFNRANDRQRRAKEYYKKEIQKAHDNAIKNANKKKESKDYTLNTSKSSINNIIKLKYSNLDNFAIYKDLINPIIPYTSGIFFMIENDYSKAVDLLKESYGISRSDVILSDMELLESRRFEKDINNYTWFIVEDGDISRKQGNTFSTPIIINSNITSINLAMPTIYNIKPNFNNYKINDYKTDRIVELSNIFVSEFEKQLPSIITRAIIGAIVKFITIYAISGATSGDYDSIAGLFANIAFSLMTYPDTRNSFVLANSIHVVRIPNDIENVTLYGDNTKLLNIKLTQDCNSIGKRIESSKDFTTLIEKDPNDFNTRIKLFEKYKKSKDICTKTDNIVYVRVRNNMATHFIIKGD